MSNFRKAARQKLKASIMIEGLQGSGKSGLALLLAKALASSDDKIFAIDTENKSLDLFQGLKSSTGENFAEFNKADLTIADGYAPSNYLALRDEAIQWQFDFSERTMSYYDLMVEQSYFYEQGKRYGLLREFRENGIL